jgi:hypothetical protein
VPKKNKITPLLTIRLEGPAIGHARIGVDRLVKLLTEFSKAVYRNGRLIESDAKTRIREPNDKSLKEQTALDVVLYTEGSRAVVVGLDRSNPEILPIHLDPTIEALHASINGLKKIQRKGNSIPDGVDLGVLLAWKEVGVLFAHGVSEMKFSLRQGRKTLRTTYTPKGFLCLQEKIKGPITNVRAVEGRLMMADFKEQGTRCRIHPETGAPILCLFKDEQKEDILDNMLHYVRIVGEAKIDPNSDRIEAIKIIDIERLEEREDREIDLLPQGTPVSSEFWVPQSFEELVRAQGVMPLSDPSVLFGTWPGGPDDNFEKRIAEMRRAQVKYRN